MNNLQLALDYAAKGYWVFPLRPRRKTPLLSKSQGGNGFHDATTDEARIRQWWGRTPRANVGISTGHSGLVVVDLDVKEADGLSNWEKRLAEEGLLLDPLVVATPSGGQHHYFRSPPVASSAGQVAPGIDVRSQGGYVVAPGSVLDGSGPDDPTGRYSVRGPKALPAVSELPEAPEALRAVLGSRETPRKPGTGTLQPLGEPGQGVAFVRELAELLQTPANRNDQLNRSAFALAQILGGGGLSEGIVRGAVEEAARQTGLGDEEIRRTLESAMSSGKDDPRVVAGVLADPESEAYRRQVEQETQRLRVQRDARRAMRDEELKQQDKGTAKSGGSFVFDIPEGVPAVWGTGSQVVWAEGEAMMLVGPPGVGKTTLTGQIVRARLGLGSGEVLGLPVTPTSSKVLYLAMDRPQQIARSLRRHFKAGERKVADARLVVWEGPPPTNFASEPESLYEMAKAHEADTIIVDSLKDAVLGLTDDLTVAAYNRARQYAIARGVVILELHHLKKAGSDGGKPNDLMGVYGSIWLTSGAGSVYMLWGEAGDELVEFIGLKPSSAGYVGPWKVRFNHEAGTTSREQDIDPLSLLSESPDGMTVTDFALKRWGDNERPTREKARRVLEGLVKKGHATKGTTGEGTQAVATYRVEGLW